MKNNFIKMGLLWITLLYQAFALTAQAAPNLVVSSATGTQGTSVNITVDFIADGTVAGLQFDLEFDDTNLDIFANKVTKPPSWPASVIFQKSNPSNKIVRIVAGDLTPQPLANGTVTFSVDIKPGATVKAYNLTLMNVSYSDTAANSVAGTANTNGVLTVTAGANVNVPNVVNQAQATATANLQAAPFNFNVTTTSGTHPTIVVGNVISQSPVAGTAVAPGSSVNLVISQGPAVIVPNVVNQTQAAANTAITGLGLTVTTTNAASATIANGNVISQNPAKNTSVAPGSNVALVISTGPANVTVPNVVGQTQAAANTAITNLGLTVATTNAASATVANGNVISQNPAAGASVGAGSNVDLVISTGPAPVIVPNVVNQTKAAATATLTGAGFIVTTGTSVTSPTIVAGNVISQNPAAGSSVGPGSIVQLVVSLGPPVTVPNLIGQNQGAAIATLTGLGLTSSTNGIFSTTVAAGKVISQSIAPNTNVAPGTNVVLNISLGAASVTPVPTMSVYGLLILSLLLTGMVGLLRLKK